MSNSTFEVKEPESESEKVLEFGLATCEENGIEMATSVDGEIAKDHTYTKEPDIEEKELSKDSGTEVNTAEEMEDSSSPNKKRGRLSRGKKTESSAAIKGKTKKVAIPKKAPTRKNKKRGTADEETTAEPEETTSNKEPEVETPAVVEATPKTPKRGKKRKIEEKENVLDQSIVEEVQNIIEDPAVNETNSGNTPKKAKPDITKKKTPKSKIASSGQIENDDRLPKGWVKKTVVRKSGKTAGSIDVYIYSPEGIKFRSRPDIAAYLAKIKSPLKVENFDFSKKNYKTDTDSSKNPIKTKTTPMKAKVEKKKKSPTKSPKVLGVKLNDSKKKKSVKVEKKSAKEAKKSKTPVKSGKAKKTALKSNKKKKTA